MMVYVIVQLVEEFENEATKPDSLDMASGPKVLPHISSGLLVHVHVDMYHSVCMYMYMFLCMHVHVDLYHCVCMYTCMHAHTMIQLDVHVVDRHCFMSVHSCHFSLSRCSEVERKRELRLPGQNPIPVGWTGDRRGRGWWR